LSPELDDTMSRPLSILATIFLLIVPSLVTDRCTAGRPSDPGFAATSDLRTAAADEAVDREGPPPRSHPRGTLWARHARWVFVAQSVVISIVHRVVLERSGDAG
jgi:hypothetical protein